ncbi:uncharacterized protein HKW66_Vig0240610 [Vigna angularis]|uniref:Uncharacterized protein n=1 Tax=Phaseolus angularis TaxID=3914 RepID=A0A8T0JID9_PHAAN|nr:uncharacterized protein HKW66_Vig0240610 [Vigna angularis]
MASSSSSKRGKKVAQSARNASPSGWINDGDVRNNFMCWRKIKIVVPHKSLDLQLFRNKGFLFQEWITPQGLAEFVQIKGECYPDLVKVFYTNLKVIDGVIHSRIKDVNITIDDGVWLSFTGLKATGLLSHIRDSDANIWLTKKAIYKDCLRYPRRYKMNKLLD